MDLNQTFAGWGQKAEPMRPRLVAGDSRNRHGLGPNMYLERL